MYPFTPGSFAPRNAWYVAAFASAVGRELIGRTIVNTPLAIYRREDGTPVALDGRCPHRHFPLAKSCLEGDVVRCGYHGFAFGPDGQCVDIPSQDHVPRAFRVRSYPVAEHGLWLWVWVGEEAKADPALLPPLGEIGLAEIGLAGGSQGEGLTGHPLIFHEVACRYQLLNDNLFDLSHLAFLHGSSIGTRENASTPEELTKRPGFVSSIRRIRDAPCPPLQHRTNAYPTDTLDRAMGMASYLPGFHAGTTEIRYPQGHPDAAGELISWSRVYHAITPATPRTCYYHFAVAVDDTLDPARMKASLAPVIDEDIFASVEIEKIIALYDGDPPPELMVKSDRNTVEGAPDDPGDDGRRGRGDDAGGSRMTIPAGMSEDERRAIEADCERLIKQYINRNDAQDWAAVAALYTEDARFARPSNPGAFIEGRAAILASFTARPPRAQRHVMANIVIDVVSANEARGFSVIVLYMGDAASAGSGHGGLPVKDPKSPLIGSFTDKLVRTADGWRFAERVGGLDFNP